MPLQADLGAQRLQSLHVQDLRKQALGYSAASNPYFTIRRRFQKLYSDFKPTRHYWRLILLSRKLSLAATTAMFTDHPMFQVRICFWHVKLD